MSKDIKLALIIPCLNEELVIESTITTLLEKLDDLCQREIVGQQSFLYFIDDGSTDRTWQIIEEYNQKYPQRVKGLKFVRNYGNQKALIAGLLGVRNVGCDCVISIDADLQQDINSIEKFVVEFDRGADIVSGIRNSRDTDTFMKKFTAICFYKVMNLLGAKIPLNHSDYRLVSAKALDVLSQYEEKELFLRGFFHETGLKTAYVNFDVKPRMAGCSKFNFLSLTNLALNGITSYSVVPLRLIFLLGLFMIFVSIIFGVDAVVNKIIHQDAPNWWATVVILVAFFGGLQMLCVGVIGEYLGQIFKEVKSRPRYIKEKELI